MGVFGFGEGGELGGAHHTGSSAKCAETAIPNFPRRGEQLHHNCRCVRRGAPQPSSAPTTRASCATPDSSSALRTAGQVSQVKTSLPDHCAPQCRLVDPSAAFTYPLVADSAAKGVLCVSPPQRAHVNEFLAGIFARGFPVLPARRDGFAHRKNLCLFLSVATGEVFTRKREGFRLCSSSLEAKASQWTGAPRWPESTERRPLQPKTALKRCGNSRAAIWPPASQSSATSVAFRYLCEDRKDARKPDGVRPLPFWVLSSAHFASPAGPIRSLPAG